MDSAVPADDRPLSIRIEQTDAAVGDPLRNAAGICDAIERARSDGVDLVVFPAAAISGRPVGSLAGDSRHSRTLDEAIDRVVTAASDISVITGTGTGRGLAVIDDAELLARDSAGAATHNLRGHRIILLTDTQPGAPVPPAATDLAGVELLIAPTASAMHELDPAGRERALGELAAATSRPLLHCGLVGAQDESVFPGHSGAWDADGRLIARATPFAETSLTLSLTRGAEGSALLTAAADDTTVSLSTEEHTWAALCTGIRDYTRKNGFPGALVAVSGGIDSALVATLACDALGPDRVSTVTMPSPHSSAETVADAHLLAGALGCAIREIPIAPLMTGFENALAESFAGRTSDTTEENLQARIRGTLMMALSNKLGGLVLVGSNRSEFAVGYSTLYGDMAGGFAPLCDLPKSAVFALARWRNEHQPACAVAPVRAPIPPSTIERPPSAELRRGQTDTDSLGDYDTLDTLLARLLDEGADPAEIIAAADAPDHAAKIIRLVTTAEHKRRQAALGPWLRPTGFGRTVHLPATRARPAR